MAPLENRTAQLTVAHFKNAGPVYKEALSRQGEIPGPLLLMLPTHHAAALRWELDSCEGLRVAREAIADGSLLALLHRGAAYECLWGALVPHLARRQAYVATPPRGHPRPAWDDLIAAFHDQGLLPDDTWQEVQQKTLGRDYWRRVRARLLELRDPLRQRWDDLWLCRLGPWSPSSHLSHTCHLCGECDTVSSAVPTGTNGCARCSEVAGCPWPEPSAGPRRRTEEEALHQRIGGAHAPSHGRAGPAGAALLWIDVHLRDPTSVAHLLHVFCALTSARSRTLQSPQHHASPKGKRAGTHQCPPPNAGGGRSGPGGGRGDGGARGARCRPARPGGQRQGFPQRSRPSARPRPERSGGPYTAPGDAPDR